MENTGTLQHVDVQSNDFARWHLSLSLLLTMITSVDSFSCVTAEHWRWWSSFHTAGSSTVSLRCELSLVSSGSPTDWNSCRSASTCTHITYNKMAPQMAATVLCSSVFVLFLFVFPVFLFLKHDQFYQGRTAEHSAEHTTKSFTGFWSFVRFAGHCSRRSSSAV